MLKFKLINGYIAKLLKNNLTIKQFNNNLGFVPIALLLFLVASVALGTYLVQNRTNILPFALDDNNCENGYRFLGGDAGDDNNWVRDEECDEDDGDDERYEGPGCDGKDSIIGVWEGDELVDVKENFGRVPGECGNQEDSGEDNDEDTREECEAKGGTWDEGNNECKTSSSSDANYDGPGCKGNHSVWANWSKRGDLLRVIEDFGARPGECGNSSDGGGGGDSKETSDRSKEDCDRAGGSWDGKRCFTSASSDGKPTGSQKDTASGEDSSVQMCKDNPDGALKPDGYTWMAFCSSSCSTNAQCKGAARTSGFTNSDTNYWCYGGKCLFLVPDNDSQVKDSKRLEDNKKAIESGARIVNNTPGTSLSTDEKDLKQYVSDIDKTLDDARAKGGVSSALQQAADKAKQLIANAQAEITKCQSSSNVQSCESQVHELYNQAKVASRLAAYQAVQAGVPNTCAKIDFGIQPFISASNGQRQFLCNDTSGTKVLRSYDLAGNPTTINANFDLDDPNKYPDEIKKHIDDAGKLILGKPLTSSSTSTTSCKIGLQSPSLSSSCVSCIKNKHSDLVSSVRNSEVSKFQACSDNEVLNYWCNGGVSSGASSDCTIKRGECSSECRATEPSTSSAGTFTTVSAAKDACRRLINTKWNDSTNKCQVDCGSSSKNVWYNGECRSSCPSNTDSENVSGVGKYCTTGGIYPFPIYQK